MAAYVDRKLFVHNLGHAAVAYLGFLHDPALSYLAGDGNPRSARPRRVRRCGSPRARSSPPIRRNSHEANQGAHIDDLLRRFTNQALGDTVFRVGRDLLRKLSREDRLIGAMLFDQAHGVDYSATAPLAAAALEFRARRRTRPPRLPDLKFQEEITRWGWKRSSAKSAASRPTTPPTTASPKPSAPHTLSWVSE